MLEKLIYDKPLYAVGIALGLMALAWWAGASTGTRTGQNECIDSMWDE
jgi:hypothetical protein